MQMPGVGFIGGKLSVIGGYSWPGGVDLLEEFDEVREGRKAVFLGLYFVRVTDSLVLT